MERVGFVTYKKNPGLSDSDELLVIPMLRYGYEVLPVAWDDESTDWSKYKCLVFRSCWNYHYSADKFSKWLDDLEDLKIKTWNPIKMVKWNMNKFYLKDFSKNNSIETIPTIYLEKGKQVNFKDVFLNSGWQQVVVKPAIGASGYKIFKSTLSEAEQNQENFTSLLESVDIMVQPLIPELVRNGETSMVFLNKKFSHAVKRRPKEGDFRSNNEFGGIKKRINPNMRIIEVGQSIVEKIDAPLLYARVDGVEKNGKFLLMELELIEPTLFLDIAEEALDKFAWAFKELGRWYSRSDYFKLV